MKDVAPSPRFLAFLSLCVTAMAQVYTVPAGVRPAMRRAGPSILPGGRIIAPEGQQAIIGPEAFGLAISPTGGIVATANRNSLTVVERDRSGRWQSRQFDGEEWQGGTTGIVFVDERAIWVAGGRSGRISRFDWNMGVSRAIDLNSPEYRDSFAGDMAADAARGKLYVLDQANLRVAMVDAKARKIVASVTLQHVPHAVAYASERKKLYVAESDSVAVLDVGDPASPKVEIRVRAGSVSGIAVSPEHVFLSNSLEDSICAIDMATNRAVAEIPIRIPGFAHIRGVMPRGLAYHAGRGWLLVAESGINAVAVIDIRARQVIGHVPTGWFPTRIALHKDQVFVTNVRGHGTGPSYGPFAMPGNMRQQGTLSIFTLPSREELAGLTAVVMEANGFQPRPARPRPLSAGVKNVVLIVKEGRTYDEYFGDVPRASNGAARSEPSLARFGAAGFADGRGERLSIKNANLAPNHRALIRRWSFSDNFYADSGLDLGAVRDHLSRHGISSHGFDEGTSGFLADQQRATQFIREIEEKYAKSDAPLPQFLTIRLPNDGMTAPRPAEGYAYAESFVADNDYAVGRVVEYLSGTKWWKEMAVFITCARAGSGLDHLDANRTVLMVAGPWARRNYVSHVNTGFPGLLKTIFRLFGVPAMGLADAAAADLSDCFTLEPEFSGYKALAVDTRVFDPVGGR